MSIVFVAYGGGHAQTLIPIAERLQEINLEFVFIGLTSAQIQLRKKNIPFIGFSQFPNSNNKVIQNIGKKLFEELPKNKIVSEAESIAYLGTNYYELEKVHGKEKARELYLKKGRQAFLPVKTFENVLTWLNADFVITTSSPRSERAAIIASRNLNIASICVVDLCSYVEVEWVKSNDYASKVCVINETVKKFLVSNGRNKSDIIVSGNPAFDQIKDKKNIIDGIALQKEKKWNDGLINILWASNKEFSKDPFLDIQCNPDLPRIVEKELREFIKSNKDFRLIVRYHPSEDVSFFEEERVFHSTHNQSIESIINAVDIVVTMASTVGLQGYYAEKEVIYVKGSMYYQKIEMLVSKIGNHVSLDNLSQTLKNLKNKLLMKNIHKSDTKNNKFYSADIIISEIRNLINLS